MNEKTTRGREYQFVHPSVCGLRAINFMMRKVLTLAYFSGNTFHAESFFLPKRRSSKREDFRVSGVAYSILNLCLFNLVREFLGSTFE